MPFGQAELDQYLSTHQLSGAAVDYIRRGAKGLSRDVRPSGHTSCVVEFQSFKTGVTVSTESRTGELPYVLELDYDDSVVAYFEQPPALEIQRHTKRGYARTARYTPDFLILRRGGPEVVQVKLRRELEINVAQKEDWVKQANGAFQDVAAAKALASVGLPHVVVAIDDDDQLCAANIALMRRALHADAAGDADLLVRVSAYMQEHGLLPLSELAQTLGLRDLTGLVRLVARHQLHTDVKRYSLMHPETCLVAREPALLKRDYVEAWRHLKLDFEGRSDGCISEHDFPLERHLKRGLAALAALDAGRKGRTARRWKAKIREAKAAGVDAVVALSRGYMKRGNRNPKRPEQIQCATSFIKANWGSRSRPSRPALYRNFKLFAEVALPRSKPLSRPSFYRLLNQLSPSLAFGRGGNRACHAAQPPSDVEVRAIKPSRPFELATCDHYLCDQYCVVHDTNGMRYAMRPWLTVLRDIYTDLPLAFWLRLGAPSKRSVSLMVRQCVRLHGRLPEAIVLDNGSDFRSVYLSALAAHCGFNLVFRPVGHPRYGSEAERFFGQYKNLWLSARPGNVADLTEVRSVSGSHQPKLMATVSLFDMWQDLLKFADWLQRYTTDSALASPAVRLKTGLETFSCSGVPAEFNDHFLIATAVDDGEYKIDPQRGLHIGAFHYWSPQLVRTKRKRIPVRIDPQDPYRVYACVDGSWTVCLASPSRTYALESGLRQAVEGVIQLDRAELNKAVREDSDRLLAQAVERRSADPPVSLTQAAGETRRSVAHETERADLFTETSQEALPELVEAEW